MCNRNTLLQMPRANPYLRAAEKRDLQRDLIAGSFAVYGHTCTERML